MACNYPCDKGAICQQTPGSDGYCFYHRKVMEGRCEEVSDYLDDAAIDTLMSGRRRYDARRLDEYVIDGDDADPT